MKPLGKLKSIVTGWLNSTIRHPAKIHNAVVRRLSICNACDLLEEMPVIKEPYCGGCNCPISAKAWSPSESCPHPGGMKWKPIDNNGNEID